MYEKEMVLKIIRGQHKGDRIKVTQMHMGFTPIYYTGILLSTGEKIGYSEDDLETED